MRLFVIFAMLMATSAMAQTVTIEGKDYQTGLKKPADWNRGVTFFNPVVHVATLPAKFDWEETVKTPVRDQKSCGSCWAFATTQTLENAVKRMDGKDIDFSEQQIVSCAKEFYGCGGGWYAGDYIVKNGQAEESLFPYSASNASCKSGLPASAKPIRWAFAGGANRAPTNDEIKTAIQTFGVVSVTVSASSGWGVDANGVLKGCGSGRTNHMVAVTGWDDSINGGSWKMKNSWGSGWGNKGYAWVKYGCYRIAEEAAYVVLRDGDPTPPVDDVPVVNLPVDVMVRYNKPISLAVKAEDGTTYQWFSATTKAKVGDGPILTITPVKTEVFTLRATNRAGMAEGSVQVNILL